MKRAFSPKACDESKRVEDCFVGSPRSQALSPRSQALANDESFVDSRGYTYHTGVSYARSRNRNVILQQMHTPTEHEDTPSESENTPMEIERTEDSQEIPFDPVQVTVGVADKDSNIAHIIRDDAPKRSFQTAMREEEPDIAEVLVLASKESIDLLTEKKDDAPYQEMAVTFENGQLVWQPNHIPFDIGSGMIKALKDGIIERIKKFKLTKNGEWLYDVVPAKQYAEAFHDEIMNEIQKSRFGQRRGVQSTASSSNQTYL